MIAMVNTWLLPEVEKCRRAEQRAFPAPSGGASARKSEYGRAGALGNSDGSRDSGAHDDAGLERAMEQLKSEISHIRRELATLRG